MVHLGGAKWNKDCCKICPCIAPRNRIEWNGISGEVQKCMGTLIKMSWLHEFVHYLSTVFRLHSLLIFGARLKTGRPEGVLQVSSSSSSLWKTAHHPTCTCPFLKIVIRLCWRERGIYNWHCYCSVFVRNCEKQPLRRQSTLNVTGTTFASLDNFWQSSGLKIVRSQL